MMDDVDRFLSLPPRPKEWMPELPGVHKLSRTDAQLDLDSILANIATTQSSQSAQPSSSSAPSSTQLQQQVSAQATAAAEAQGDRTSSRKAQRTAAAAAAAAAAGKPVKTEGKEAPAAHTDGSAPHSSPTHTHCALLTTLFTVLSPNDPSAASSPPSHRSHRSALSGSPLLC